MLANIAEKVIFATYEQFAAAAAQLEQATAAHAAQPSATTLKAAQQAWRGAMKLWQRLEVMQVGPAAPMKLPGGKDLRDKIYSWPSVNRCAVDQELVKGEYTDPSVFAGKLVNVKGLAALEYMLFYEGSSNACAPQSLINTDGSWKAIEPSLFDKRAQYGKTLAQLVKADAEALREAWKPSGGDFLGEMTRPGKLFGEDAHKALNSLSNAMFYVDTRTKDLKLAVPAGLSNCDTPTCPQALESRFAAFSKTEIRENLSALQLMFHGGASFDAKALGFDDWLIAVGANQLSSQMAADIAAALAAVDAIEEDDLADALKNDKKSVEDVYFAVKRITDNLKSQFITVLNLELPMSAATDND
jgi:predicted lipoprotein